MPDEIQVRPRKGFTPVQLKAMKNHYQNSLENLSPSTRNRMVEARETLKPIERRLKADL